jgi:hypothetical protein
MVTGAIDSDGKIHLDDMAQSESQREEKSHEETHKDWEEFDQVQCNVNYPTNQSKEENF